MHTTHRAAHAHAPPIRAVPERVQRFQHVIALVHVRLRPCIQMNNKHTGERAVHHLSALRTCLLVSKFAEPTAHAVFGSVHAPLPKGAALHPAPVSPAVCSCHVGNERGAKTARECVDLKTQNSDQVRTGILSSSRENSLNRASEARAGCWARNWLRVLAAARYQLFLRGSAATP